MQVLPADLAVLDTWPGLLVSCPGLPPWQVLVMVQAVSLQMHRQNMRQSAQAS